MGERKGQNKYYPPDFDWRKHSSLNQYQGTHALRERARKLHMGILIIRFEMPYNIWCNGCGNHIGMGVRYNAEKTKIGNYYTTPLWQFRMKCHLCDNHFEIKTDPKARDYIIVSGARREEQRWDASQNGQIVVESEMKKLATDAMFKLEHDNKDQTKTAKTAPDINALEEHQLVWKDDYAINYVLRKELRATKKHAKLQKEKDDILLKKASLSIPLVPASREDDRLSQLYKLAPVKTAEESEIERRTKIENQQILKGTSTCNTEITWEPSTFTNNKKNLSSRFGIIRNCDNKAKQLPLSPENTTNNSNDTISAKERTHVSLVSGDYNEADDDSS
ncbi:unnamed protein product [Didymodactylos carnosus]|uniref:Coiled-coil domain-containing protein 130 n=1 Tax=Didymodactylos carnosus TaxID=1234261 RepID=A0A8S2D9G7_9BILA|nr:unnamed protein product [Didymodactylos carnosus]CAF3692688.1 unnamed protein product [Didymodactylos carnosus]